jgi:hypothetical protein
MAREKHPRESEWADSNQELVPRQSQSRLVLGVIVFSIVIGYVVFRYARGSFGTEIDLLILVLGSVLGSTLIGDYVSPEFRSRRYHYLLIPGLELLITYSLFGVLTAAVYSGLVVVSVVSGLLLFCSFSAFILVL